MGLASAWGTIQSTYRTWRQYGNLTDSWHERLRGYLVALATSESFPNIILGSDLGFLLANLRFEGGIHVEHLPQAILFQVALLVSVLMYAVGDDVRYALKAAREEFSGEPIGIE